jgi:hypothetical protein
MAFAAVPVARHHSGAQPFSDEGGDPKAGPAGQFAVAFQPFAGSVTPTSGFGARCWRRGR